MTMFKRLLSIVLVAAAALALSNPALAQGCSGCRAAMEFSAEGRVMGASLNSGILMLMGAPYLLLATFGFAVYRGYRKSHKKAQDRLDS